MWGVERTLISLETNISLYGRFIFTSIHTPVRKACEWNTLQHVENNTHQWDVNNEVSKLITDLGLSFIEEKTKLQLNRNIAQ